MSVVSAGGAGLQWCPAGWRVGGALYATYRHYNKQDNLPAVSLLTPIVPLIFVLSFRWDIIPAFILGLVYGTLTTWRRDSINILTRSIIDGVSNVIPAVLLMMGIGT